MSVLSKSQLYEFRNSTRYFSKAVNESLNEFSSESKVGKTTIFLSHKHDEKKELDSVISFLKKINVNVYVDWLDEGMPKTTSGKTATRIKLKIKDIRKPIHITLSLLLKKSDNHPTIGAPSAQPINIKPQANDAWELE